jgi:hypothetical protein
MPRYQITTQVGAVTCTVTFEVAGWAEGEARSSAQQRLDAAWTTAACALEQALLLPAPPTDTIDIEDEIACVIGLCSNDATCLEGLHCQRHCTCQDDEDEDAAACQRIWGINRDHTGDEEGETV